LSEPPRQFGHLVGQAGLEVYDTLKIQAEIPDGASVEINRRVSESATSL
jgi:hypothetical protein